MKNFRQCSRNSIAFFMIFPTLLIFNYPARSFHSGGVGYCDGCHSMHGGAAASLAATAADGGRRLLRGSDASSACLNCHAGTGAYRVASQDGANVNQGGDFFWARTDYIYETGEGPVTSWARSHGHNIDAADFGFSPDTEKTTAPGGIYNANLLGCTSCHDAHGKVNGGAPAEKTPIIGSGSYGEIPVEGYAVGNFRLLGGEYYLAGDHAEDGHRFSFPAPVAVSSLGPHNYGAKTDYGEGMSEWCANCHPAFYNAGGKHPVITLPPDYIRTYNQYKFTGDITGTQDLAYDPLVPIERGTADLSQLDPDSTIGADAGARVMCLTCHRAHASAFDYAGRWDFRATFLGESSTRLAISGLLGSEADYYENGGKIDTITKYGRFQRSLCNKCHLQD